VNSRANKIDALQIGAIACVIIHVLLNIAHGAAHGRLGISLSDAQTIFVAVVVLAAPLVAAFLLWMRKPRTGAVLLVISMAGAFLFGFYFHFALPGPDNVAQPAISGMRHWQKLFVSTAFGLATMEALGALLGLIILIRTFAPGKDAGPSNISGKLS